MKELLKKRKKGRRSDMRMKDALKRKQKRLKKNLS